MSCAEAAFGALAEDMRSSSTRCLAHSAIAVAPAQSTRSAGVAGGARANGRVKMGRAAAIVGGHGKVRNPAGRPSRAAMIVDRRRLLMAHSQLRGVDLARRDQPGRDHPDNDAKMRRPKSATVFDE